MTADGHKTAGAIGRAVPQEGPVREAVRRAAGEAVRSLGRLRPPGRDELERLGGRIVEELKLRPEHLGFCMVAVDNAFWREQFAAMPFGKRLLLLPHCLRDTRACKGVYNSSGLTCARCGACAICSIEEEARKLGYKVLVAEGTPAVVQTFLNDSVEAVLGVACLESLEKAFERVSKLGIPHAAVPLLRDGCKDTAAELERVMEVLRESGSPEPRSARTRAYLPLLREAARLCEPPQLARLLEPVRSPGPHRLGPAFAETESVALDWLGAGGKRLRPFITLAAYAAEAIGAPAFQTGADLSGAFSDAVRRIALAIEVMHKASLVHDDIEDGDELRYGRSTVHAAHGVPAAINAGDWLVGLGYRLVAAAVETLGAPVVAGVLEALSEAHLELSRGQGAELALRATRPGEWRPEAIEAVYALKTAPAFEAAFRVGLAMASPASARDGGLRRYSRMLGVAYQIGNDLADWDESSGRRMAEGESPTRQSRYGDGASCVALATPTILAAFAIEAEPGSAALFERMRSGDAEAGEALTLLRALYERTGAFERARALARRLRGEAIGEAAGFGDTILAETMRLVVEVVL